MQKEELNKIPSCDYGGMVDALVSEASGATRGSSSLLGHTILLTVKNPLFQYSILLK